MSYQSREKRRKHRRLTKRRKRSAETATRWYLTLAKKAGRYTCCGDRFRRGAELVYRHQRADLGFYAWDLREWHFYGRAMQDYVALILTPIWDHRNGGESWVRPNVAAWRMYAPDETRGDDQFICEPANVEVEK